MNLREFFFYGLIGGSFLWGGALSADDHSATHSDSESIMGTAMEKESGDSIVFSNAFHKFSVEFPDTWELEQGFSSEGLDFVVVALSPSEGEGDKFIENMNILVEELTEAVPLDQYFDWNLRGLKQELPGFTVKDQSKVEIDGVPMVRIAYTWTVDDSETSTYQYIFVKENKGFVLTFSSNPEKFEQYRPTFDKIARSFDFEEMESVDMGTSEDVDTSAEMPMDEEME